MKVTCIALMLCATLLCAGTLEQRRAARVEIDKGNCRPYLANEDVEIRRYALYRLAAQDPEKELEALKAAVTDKEALVRYTAVTLLGRLAGKNAQADELLEKLANDADKTVRDMATQFSWPFKNKNMRLSEDPSWDHEVTTIKSIEIPQDDWRLLPDEKNRGHKHNYFAPKFNDSNWYKAKCGYWNQNGMDAYDGYAWYRIRFKMPAKMDCNAVEVRFVAVDESAWVWLNGKYIGSHDLGGSGYNKTFSLDCRKEIMFGKENILVVRVLDREQGGGIWKPIFIDILK